MLKHDNRTAERQRESWKPQKRSNLLQRTLNKVNCRFFHWKPQRPEDSEMTFKVLKEKKKCQPRIIPRKTALQKWGQNYDIPQLQKRRQPITSRSALWEGEGSLSDRNERSTNSPSKPHEEIKTSGEDKHVREYKCVYLPQCRRRLTCDDSTERSGRM